MYNISTSQRTPRAISKTYINELLNIIIFFCRPDGSRQKKRVRLPHNTMERQRQKVLQDGEYIMYETPPQRQVSFHLPPETNGYGKLLINNYLPTD
jgi:hypothetical protein